MKSFLNHNKTNENVTNLNSRSRISRGFYYGHAQHEIKLHTERPDRLQKVTDGRCYSTGRQQRTAACAARCCCLFAGVCDRRRMWWPRPPPHTLLVELLLQIFLEECSCKKKDGGKKSKGKCFKNSARHLFITYI